MGRRGSVGVGSVVTVGIVMVVMIAAGAGSMGDGNAVSAWAFGGWA